MTTNELLIQIKKEVAELAEKKSENGDVFDELYGSIYNKAIEDVEAILEKYE